MDILYIYICIYNIEHFPDEHRPKNFEKFLYIYIYITADSTVYIQGVQYLALQFILD